MRISDWSSDVCSSDLEWGSTDIWRFRHVEEKRTARRGAVGPGGCRADVGAGQEGKLRRGSGHERGRRSRQFRDGRVRLGRGRDRKSGLTGKSGSVRVDLGGRRISTKQKI